MLDAYLLVSTILSDRSKGVCEAIWMCIGQDTKRRYVEGQASGQTILRLSDLSPQPAGTEINVSDFGQTPSSSKR